MYILAKFNTFSILSILRGNNNVKYAPSSKPKINVRKNITRTHGVLYTKFKFIQIFTNNLHFYMSCFGQLKNISDDKIARNQQRQCVDRNNKYCFGHTLLLFCIGILFNTRLTQQDIFGSVATSPVVLR